MAFLDDDGLDPAPRGGGPRRPGSDRQRQLLVRRLIALGVGVLVVILLLLGIRGCLNAREERGFENFVSDLNSIVTTSNQLSSGFFARLLEPPNNLTELNLEAEIASDRGTAEQLLQRVEGLDTPDDLADAQQELVQAFELRRDALEGIAEDIPTALGDEARDEAIERIAEDMRIFLASDVLYARAQTEVIEVLDEQQIAGEIESSQFLSEPVGRWLDDLELYSVLNSFATETGAVQGLHGIALISTEVNKSPLSVDLDNSVSLGNDEPAITLTIENQGEEEENDVKGTFTLSGGSQTIEGEGTIAQLDAGGSQEVTIPLSAEPDTGVPLTLEAQAVPVLGEQDATNNGATYRITFE